MQSLLQDVVSSRSSDTYAAMVENLSHSAPLLYQYKDIVHHHVISNLATYRTMGKLLSVLLSMFTDLATKVISNLFMYVRGQVVSVFDINKLAPHCCWFESCRVR